jgi:hypothetical protein
MGKRSDKKRQRKKRSTKRAPVRGAFDKMRDEQLSQRKRPV